MLKVVEKVKEKKRTKFGVLNLSSVFSLNGHAFMKIEAIGSLCESAQPFNAVWLQTYPGKLAIIDYERNHEAAWRKSTYVTPYC